MVTSGQILILVVIPIVVGIALFLIKLWLNKYFKYREAQDLKKRQENQQRDIKIEKMYIKIESIGEGLKASPMNGKYTEEQLRIEKLLTEQSEVLKQPLVVE